MPIKLDGSSSNVSIQSGSFETFQLNVTKRMTLELELEYETDQPQDLAVYGRNGAPPTHTRYDFTNALNSDGSVVKKRSAFNQNTKTFDVSEVLDPGHWFVAIFNGGGKRADLRVRASQTTAPLPCANDCNGRGVCFNGTCVCLPQWKGRDCGEANCESADCGGHGDCRDGQCHCDRGWKGSDCTQPDCIVPDCSSHGQCVNGICQCDLGWKGTACDTVKKPCPGDCFRHGVCNDDTGVCTCEAMWTGTSCNTALCTDDCNARGDCSNGTCLCDEPWTGHTCDTIACAEGCETHGACDNGTCNCGMGWGGNDCLTDVCPNNCHGTGSCRRDDTGEWHCACVPGFRGIGCDIGVELVCDDGLDNDADLLFDCDDPDCCNTTACQYDEACMAAPDPSELVANITSNTTVSFFDSIQFLFDNNLQIGIDLDFIDRARVSVIKGRATTRDTTPLIGVTVAVLNEPAYGHTLTRLDGSYDIAVNGGSAITLTYNRRNFIGSQRSVVVPVNNYVSVDDIAMITVDTQFTEVDLADGSDDLKVAAGSRVEDDSGSRQGVLMFPPNTEATIVTVNGTQNNTIERPVIRVTEYTVGSRGEEAMPAELPAFTGYTYAVEMSIDQATVNGSTEVVFNQILPYYVENYLGFPVGSAVPTGYYNRTLGEWVPSENGRVVLVLNITTSSDGKNLAVLDVTGDGLPATQEELDALGVTAQELEQVASRYGTNQSLWRVPIRHFTPWDCNWPYGPPPDGCTPYQCDPDGPIGNPYPDGDPNNPCPEDGSIIIAQTQALGQQLDVAGTGLSLFYFSDRVLGYQPIISIPLTAANLPESLRRVHLTIEVQGRTFKETFPAQPNQDYRFIWDRRDSYGRTVLGQVSATVSIGYEYGLVYYAVQSDFRQSFNRLSDASITRPVGRRGREAVFWEKKTVQLGGPLGPVESAGLGGWSVDIHHSYDPPSGVLHMGTGRKIGFRDRSKIVQTVAGTSKKRPQTCPQCLASQKGTSASLLAPVAIAVAADGSLFIGDYQLIRRLYPNGNITTVVDLSSRPPSHAYYLAVSPVDGDLFISYGTTHQVYRMKSTLLLPGQPPITFEDIDQVPGATVFAGTGQPCLGWDKSCGDGDLAIHARLAEPKGITVGARGAIYFADGKVVRQVGVDGIIATFAGSRFLKGCAPPGCSRETSGDVPLDQSYFSWPTDIAVRLDDESLYAIDGERILYITREGQVRTAAGISPHIPPKFKNSQSKDAPLFEFSPIPAVGAELKSLRGLVIAPDGSVFFGETDGKRVNRIRALDQSGNLVTLGGTDPGCNCAYGGSSCLSQCFSGDGQAALAATFYLPSGLGLSPDGDTLYIADQGNARIRSVRVRLPKVTEGFYTIPSEDGTEAYQFDFSGRHFSTSLTSTGQIMYTFDYDEFETNSGPKGLLVGITDSYNNTLKIERSANGQPLGLRSPFGFDTAVENDANGYLSHFKDPTGSTTEFTYGTHGLMNSMTEPNDLVHTFSYDGSGRLTRDRRPDGGATSLSSQQMRDGNRVSLRSNSGRLKVIETSSVASESVLTVTEQTGAQTVTRETSGGVRRMSYGDGTSTEQEETDHPIWGQQLPVISRLAVELPSGKAREVTSQYFADLSDDSDPFSATRFGHTLKVDDTDWINVEYTRATNTKTIKHLQSNLETQITYNMYGEEIESVTAASGLDPVRTKFDPRGLVSSVSQGHLDLNFTYDFRGRLISEGMDDTRSISYGYAGNDDQPSNMTLPSGKTYQFSYDSYDNLASITMPSGSVHRLSTTVTVGKTTESYSAPRQTFSVGRDFDSEGDLHVTRFPSGNRSVHEMTDQGGRPVSTTYDDTVIDYEYSDNTDRVTRIVRAKLSTDGGVILTPQQLDDDVSFLVLEAEPGSSTISYGYDGRFVTRQAVEMSGDDGDSLLATFEYQYSDNMLQTTTTLNTDQGHASSVTVGYDSASRISTFAGFSIDYSQTRTVTITDTACRLTTQYDGSGHILERSLTVKGKNALTMKLSYGSGSLIIKRELEFGTDPSAVYGYVYDADGQLFSVSRNGFMIERYTYDQNGNRILWTSGQTFHSAVYDDRDQLKKVDLDDYEIDVDGFLSVGGDAVYKYSPRGELLSVSKRSSGDRIYSYVYDGLGRRVMRTDAFGSTNRYLYGDQANPQRVTHIVNDNELVVFYYDLAGLLFAMDKGNQRYYVATDQLGTPLALIDGTSGQISKQLEYTAYGVILSDSNPSLSTEFGFAGGLLDPETSLVHFMFRDYDAVAGRWTARDPTLYTSMQPNLYQYSFNDPVNLVDPLGLFCIGGSFYAKFGGGGKFCIDRSGVSVCAEAGVGVGASANLDFTGRPSRPGHKVSVFAEGWAGRRFGPVGAAGAATFEYELTKPPPCQDRFNWDVWGAGNIRIPGGNVQGRYSLRRGGSVHVVHRSRGAQKWGAQWQAKAGVRYCHGWSF